MEMTMNQTNLGLGNGKTGWNLPEFGIQKYATKAVESVFHTIRECKLNCVKLQ